MKLPTVSTRKVPTVSTMKFVPGLVISPLPGDGGIQIVTGTFTGILIPLGNIFYYTDGYVTTTVGIYADRSLIS